MEGYYQAQASMPYFSGAARQRGRGLGSLALSIGRTALPIFKKFIVPAAKRIGRNVMQDALPEVMDVVSGRAKPRQALKRTMQKTVKRQIGGSQPKRCPGKRKAKKRVTKKKSRTKRSRVDILGKLS